MTGTSTDGSRHESRRFSPTDLLALGIGLIWIVGAGFQLADLDYFRSVVEAHGVLPASILRLLPCFSVAEACLGAAVVLVGGSKRSPRAGMAITGASMIGVIGLTMYLGLVPEESLRLVGCGCHGALRLVRVPVFGREPRITGITFNTVLVLSHLPLLRASMRATRSAG